jgi:gas vesicle protein
MSDNNFNSAHLMLAFLGGAVTGAAVAYLTAPRSGRETRQWISDSLANQRDEIAMLPPALRAAYEAATEAAKGAYRESLAASHTAGKAADDEG